MSLLLSSKRVVARKAHNCRTCGTAAIQPGETYQREAYLCDGRAYTWISCRECAALLDVVWEWAGRPDEGVGAEEYVEWARESVDDPEHAAAAKAYLARIGAPA